MKLTILYLSIVLCVVYAKPQQRFQEDPPQPYDFSYKVENPPTNTFFGQNENGDAQNTKTGSYYVLLPDGRTLTVDYTANDQGFIPKLSYQQGTGGKFQG